MQRNPLIGEVQKSFPRVIEEPVYHCGFHSEVSFGATAYFVKHTQGDFLVDSPRFNQSLVKSIEAQGGLRWMLLTHCDDVADHKKWQEHFNCERVIHEKDLRSDTRDCELILRGAGPFDISPQFRALWVPGHGRRARYNKDEMPFEMERCIQWMQSP